MRVALVYVGVAYVVVEAGDLILPRLQLPEWTVALVIGLAILGFPIAVVLAWAYELTPDGIRPTPPPGGAEPGETPWVTTRALAVAVALLVVGVGLGWALRPTGHVAPGARALAESGAVAVLPFANLSANADSTRHLSDGFHRELLMQLHRIGLEVRPRASVMRFQGSERPLSEIAGELGVAYVLEGTVAFSGSSARLSADLIDVAREAPMWNESYDLELAVADVFGTQSEIARQIAGALRAEISPQAAAELERRPTDDLEAWSLVQRGISLWQSARDSADYAASLRAFERANEIDPDYAAPYVGIVLVRATVAASGLVDPFSWMRLARDAGVRALELDPRAALDFGVSARSLLAFQRVWFEWDFEGAREDLERLIAEGEDLGPFFYLFTALGEHDRAIELLEGRVEGAPGSPFFRTALAEGLYAARRYERAVEEARLAINLSSGGDADARQVLGKGLMRLGREEEGIAELRANARQNEGVAPRAVLAWGLGRSGDEPAAREILAELRSDVGEPGLSLAAGWLARLGAGDEEGAIDALERAADRRHVIVIGLGQNPDADPLRARPRFVALLDRIGIPESARYRLEP